MSNRSSRSRDDDEELNLALEFQGLQISIRGSPDRAASFVQRLATDLGRETTDLPDTGGYRNQVRPAPSVAPSSASWQEVEAPQTPPRRETRASIEASFPTCPPHLCLLGSSLSSTTSGWSPEQRVQRAWKAGNWARATKEGRVQSPNRTPTIDLGNRYYAVIRGPSIRSPRVYQSSRELFGAVGSLEGSNTICHGFPSKTETQIYLAGAGFEDVPIP